MCEGPPNAHLNVKQTHITPTPKYSSKVYTHIVTLLKDRDDMTLLTLRSATPEQKKRLLLLSPPALPYVSLLLLWFLWSMHGIVQSNHYTALSENIHPINVIFVVVVGSRAIHTLSHTPTHMMISLVSKCNGTSSGGNSNNKTIPVTRDRLWWKKHREKVDSYHHSSGRYNQSIVWQWAQ